LAVPGPYGRVGLEPPLLVLCGLLEIHIHLVLVAGVVEKSGDTLTVEQPEVDRLGKLTVLFGDLLASRDAVCCGEVEVLTVAVGF
jgi:hypothetical protein